jgi:ABC-2 type transport system permease protein
MMIALIAKRELTQFRRDGRLYWAGGLVLLLLITALIVGAQRREQIAAEHSAGERASYEHWVGQGPVNPHSAAHFGMYVFKPAPPLSLFDPGIDPYTGVTLWLEAHKQNPFIFRPAQDATGLLRFGGFSAAWALQVLAPLLIIVLGFGAFAAEREQGTLRQALSIGAMPQHLFWGKVLALSVPSTALLLAVLIALLVASANSHEASAVDSLVRTLAVVIGYALYLGVFVFLALAVSAWSASSRVALLILLAVWITVVVLVPRAVDHVARAIYPTPTQFAFTSALSAEMAKAYDEALLKEFNAKRWAEVPASKFGASLVALEMYERSVHERHYDRLWNTFERQQKLQEWSGLVAPLMAVRALSSGLAGTDIAHWRDFGGAAENYRRKFETLVNADAAKYGGDQGYNYKAHAELWKQVPKFNYQMPSFAWALSQLWPALAILALNFAVSVMLALAAARRLSV